MFFLMLITVGIDTEFGMLEGVVTPIIDQKLFPKLKKEYISGWFVVLGSYCASQVYKIKKPKLCFN